MRSYQKASTALIAILLFSLFLPLAALAAVEADDLPAGATWYFHADLAEMRATDSGKSLFAWLDKEVFDEVREESGVDLAKEVSRITAYSTLGQGAVMVIDGQFSQQTRDKSMVAAAAAERFDTLKSGSKTYYYVQGDDDFDADELRIDGVDNKFYFSWDIDNKLVVASRQEQMESLLKSNGRITGARAHKGTLFLLSAERSLIQAGMDAGDFRANKGTDDGGFQSNILRNTEQVAVLIADVAGKIAIEAQLVTAEPEMAESLASIVRGLIALQAFAEDMEPAVAQILQGTRVEVSDKAMKISLSLAPETIVTMLDDA